MLPLCRIVGNEERFMKARIKRNWLNVIAEQERSGKTQSQFCAEAGISLANFQKQKLKLKKGSLKFIELNASSQKREALGCHRAENARGVIGQQQSSAT